MGYVTLKIATLQASSPVEETGPAVAESLQLRAGVVGVVVTVVLDQFLRQPFEVVHCGLTAVDLLLQLLQHGQHLSTHLGHHGDMEVGAGRG